MPDMKHLPSDTAKTFALAAVNRLKANLPEGWEVRPVEKIHGLGMKEAVVVIAPKGSTATLLVVGDSRGVGGAWSSRYYKATISLTLADGRGVRQYGGRRSLTRRYDVTSPEGEFNTKGFWNAATDLLAKATEIEAVQAVARETVARNEEVAKALSEVLGVRTSVGSAYEAGRLRATFDGTPGEMAALVARLREKVNG